MTENKVKPIEPLRRNAFLYATGLALLYLMAVLTLTDILRIYFSFGMEYAVGMMIPRMGVMLGYGGTSFRALICTIVSYAYLALMILFSVLAVRKFFCGMIALVLFSVDSLVAIWLFLSIFPVGFLPTFVIHITVEIFLIVAVIAGNRLGKGRFRGLFYLAFSRNGSKQ